MRYSKRNKLKSDKHSNTNLNNMVSTFFEQTYFTCGPQEIFRLSIYFDNLTYPCLESNVDQHLENVMALIYDQDSADIGKSNPKKLTPL